MDDRDWMSKRMLWSRIAEVKQPVGCTIAGARETRLFHKDFQKNRSVAVALLPVLGQLFEHTGENMRGQVLAQIQRGIRKRALLAI